MATINGSSGQAGYSFWAEVSETIPSDYITYNYTYVKTVIKIKNGGSRTDTNGWTLVVNVNGSEVFKDTNYRLNTYNGGSAGYYDEFTLATINNIRIPHETNGSKTITVSAELYKSSYASYDPGHCYIPASGVSNRIQLTTIPRYTSITSFDVSKIDETSIRVTWDAANTCDRVRYSLNNGSWVTLSTFSKNFVIDNLTANTQYSVKISVRRSDSQLDTNSDPKSVTTYAYPSIRSNGVPSFVIGNDFNILLDNPLGRTCNVTLIGDNNSEKAALATTGTTINGFNASEWITFFNNSLPSSVEGNYKIRLVCSTGNINIESSTSKYYINTNDTTYKPIFTDQNIINVQNSDAYASISGTDKFIKNHNNLVGQIVKMTPQKGSNGNYYEISATGIVTQRKTYSNDNISFSLENVSSSNFAITAYDSRSIFYTKVEKSINLIDYNNPTINSNSVNITRQNIIGDKAIIDISGGYTDWENLLEDNTIQSIKYRVGDSGAFNNLPSGSDIDIGNGDWSVYTTLEDTFDVRSSYNLYFQVTDLLETVVFGPYVLSTADAYIWKDLQNRYIGINKKPTCELDVNGAAKFSKTSRNYNDGALVGAKEVSATTMSNIISELRYTNGQIGSFNLQTAYTLNSITIPTGWYNYTWMPHRFGGNSGQATSDNCNYGTLFMTGMNTQNGPYIVHFINQQIDCIQVVGSVVDNLDGESTTNAPSIHAVNESLWTSGRTDLTDCNDMLKDGVYGWSGTTVNTPVANSWGTLLTLNNWLINGRNDNTTVQLGVVSDSNDERVYFRERYGSSGWSTWKSIYGKKAREMVGLYSTSNRTTSSTTDVDISGASTTINTYGGDLLINTTISAKVTGNMGFISLYIDDTLIEEIMCLNATVDYQSITVSSLVIGLSAGSHTIKLKMHVQKSSNVLTINNYNTNKFTIVEL